MYVYLLSDKLIGSCIADGCNSMRKNLHSHSLSSDVRLVDITKTTLTQDILPTRGKKNVRSNFKLLQWNLQ